VSYQQPPEHRTGASAGPPQGWHPDPGGLQALRWWDGTRWSPHTQPLPSVVQEPHPPYPGAASTGYDEFRQERAGRHRQQGGPQDGMAYQQGLASDPSAAPFPSGQPQQPDQYQPKGWPQQQAYALEPRPQAHRAPRRPGNRKARRALIGLGTLIGVIAVVSVVTADNSLSTGNVAATSPVPAASPAAASASPPDCRSQVISWRDNGGVSQLEAVVTDNGERPAGVHGARHGPDDGSGHIPGRGVPPDRRGIAPVRCADGTSEPATLVRAGPEDR
jgi:hypothetical protein